MSLLLVLASLFPPTEEFMWNAGLNWQPIPFNTSDYDKVCAVSVFKFGFLWQTFQVLYGRKVCTNYKTKYKKYVKTDEVLEMLEPYQEMFDYVSEKTGLEIQKAKKAADLYIELLVQVSWMVQFNFFRLKFEF